MNSLDLDMMNMTDTIAAVSTPPGVGGIAVIRVSGKDAIDTCDRIWRGKRLTKCASHTAHFGEIVNTAGDMVDTAVATIYRAPRSFTGEDTVELSIHGSPWLQREVVSLLIDAGARSAAAGEFTRRAFVNGRLDLAQAEGVADMISVSSAAAQRLASRQMKGDFSRRLDGIRDEMVTLASLLELELDFSEEDVEFADRAHLADIADRLIAETDRLAGSFRTGQALKEGVNVVIIGCPNAGKSTLLNSLLGEDKAIVSDIAGTTRDIIEDTAEIDGILFRFIDTAGLRSADDTIERLGIERARQRIARTDIIIALIDGGTADILSQIAYLKTEIAENTQSLQDSPAIIYAVNKTDISTINGGSAPIKSVAPQKQECLSENILTDGTETIYISAKTGDGLEQLKARLIENAAAGIDLQSELIVTNERHYQSLASTRDALKRFRIAMTDNLPTDLLAQDLREAIHHLGEITGSITTDTLLHTVFSRFCIGK